MKTVGAAFGVAMAFGKVGEEELFAAALDLFDALCRGSGLAPFATVAKSFRTWRAEIVAYAATGGASNAWAEAVNHLIKNQKRHGPRLQLLGRPVHGGRRAAEPGGEVQTRPALAVQLDEAGGFARWPGERATRRTAGAARRCMTTQSAP